MKRAVVILSMLLAVSSSYSQNDENIKKLIPVVSDIQAITEKDDGKFWNIKYTTPLLFVNPENRQAVAFDVGKEPYEVLLDETVPISNTSSNWNGKMWAMIQTPLPKQSFECEKLILHEMFHVLQPSLNFDSLFEVTCEHLEQKDARILLRLELQALLKALQQSNNKDSLYYHLINAFSFRNSRYIMYPEAKENENKIELNEGMAEYTALMMTQRYSNNKLNANKLITYFNNRISSFEKKNFIRSFAYETIPLYGYLIQMDIPDWHQKVTKKTNLTDYFMQIMGIHFREDWENVAPQYGYKYIMTEENDRFEQMVAVKNAITEKFLCVNHVEIPLFQYNMSFNPNEIMIIESVGETYINTVFMDIWGKLETHKGLLLDKEHGKVFLSPIIKTENSIIFGDGWELRLNDDWIIAEQQDWMEIQKK
jgi:hypothetical protein